MKVFTVLAALTASLISALPILDERQAAPGINYFYLQTQVYGNNPDLGTNKSGQYVFSYHTGAGLGIAAEEVNLPGMVAYLNGSLLSFTYSSSPGPWPVAIAYGPYQTFNEISISIAGGLAPTDGFYINETGLQNNHTDGWLACDWWYTRPQIFSITPGYATRTLPKTCSRVRLCPRPATLSSKV